VTERFERLQWEIAELNGLYKLLDERQLQLGVYPEWDALDVLRHLVWWHESFAAIVQAAAEGVEGDVPKGSLAEVNARSVASLAQVSRRSLLRRLALAQRQIEDHHELPAEQSLGYRRGSRRYSFAERIQISIGELSQHRRDVLQAVLAADRVIGDKP
jgi:hypothetical protein